MVNGRINDSERTMPVFGNIKKIKNIKPQRLPEPAEERLKKKIEILRKLPPEILARAINARMNEEPEDEIIE